jgi:hypothetical protein
MKRSIRRMQWCGLLVCGLLILAASGLALADNVFPTPNGNVGIGSVIFTPNAPLHVKGSANVIQNMESTSSGNNYVYQRYVTGSRAYEVGVGAGGVGDIPNSFFIYDEVGNNYRLVINPNGYVGVGTANPGALLHVRGTGNVFQNLETASPTNYTYQRYVTGSRTFEVGVGAQGVGDIPNSLFIYDEQAGAYRMVVTSNGNVGIGTIAPAAKFHVAGDAQVDGNLAAKYQDVAEWVQTATPLPAGVVVVVDSKNRNQVLAASGAYDTRVAGVVSARPGLLLGEAGDSKVKVAHSGRVKVKVDASYGSVEVGDLLVTSPTSGHAMRSTPVELGGTSLHRPGTLLGKALEPLDAGQGEILVLLTLQ